MKKIEAIIRTSKFEDVKEALHNIGVDFFTYHDVKGIGRQKGHEATYRGTVYDVGSISRRTLEILVKPEEADQVINTIQEAAKTGEIGDGKITVYEVEKLLRVRTGETGADAL